MFSDYAAFDFGMTLDEAELQEIIDALDRSQIRTPTTERLGYRLSEALDRVRFLNTPEGKAQLAWRESVLS